MNDELIERLVRMETKLDMALTAWDERLNRHAERLADHEERVRILEAAQTSNYAISRWKATTGLSIVLALIAQLSWIVPLL